ncbi:hypothetical protein LCGC14_1261550 [marine sediment metagenome]|uniref:HNH endonuclease n=1 Tax=marine sediment metagenome TaxID=412755 RepID=A0A0F9L0H1_9ZZZZ
MKTKRCGHCKQTKDAAEFCPGAGVSSHLICKPCTNEQRRSWYAREPEKLRANSRASNNRLRVEVFEHYGTVCACCGESDIRFLTLDHIAGDGAAHRKDTNTSGIDMYRWLRKHGFPSGIQVLCYNCNCAKYIYKRCPHQEDRR